MIQVVCLVASLESKRPHVQSPREPHEQAAVVAAILLLLARSRLLAVFLRSPIRTKNVSMRLSLALQIYLQKCRCKGLSIFGE